MYYVYLLKLKDKSFYTGSTPDAIVTDQGGSTSHAVIVSHKLAISCCDIFEATKKTQRRRYHYRRWRSWVSLANLAGVEVAEGVAKLLWDGVGLLRAELKKMFLKLA